MHGLGASSYEPGNWTGSVTRRIFWPIHMGNFKMLASEHCTAGQGEKLAVSAKGYDRQNEARGSPRWILVLNPGFLTVRHRFILSA